MFCHSKILQRVRAEVTRGHVDQSCKCQKWEIQCLIISTVHRQIMRLLRTKPRENDPDSPGETAESLCSSPFLCWSTVIFTPKASCHSSRQSTWSGMRSRSIALLIDGHLSCAWHLLGMVNKQNDGAQSTSGIYLLTFCL